MKKTIIAVIAIVAAVSAAQAGETMMGDLSSAGNKISAVDMKKDLGKAGNILDGFFSGAAAKKNSVAPADLSGDNSSVESGSARNIYGQTAEQLVNAKPARKALSSTVAPLSVQAASLTKGAGGSSYWDDVATVVGHATSEPRDTFNIAIQAIKDSAPKPEGRTETAAIGARG